MKKILASLLFLFLAIVLDAQEKVTLSGRVTDFSGHPVDSAQIRVLDRDFKVRFMTYSDKEGYYSIEAVKEIYNCIYAIKVPDYRKTKLEYWAWNVPLFEDMEINPMYNNMEIYGINVFEPQVTPYETYMLYFRPMSLQKMIRLIERQDIDKESFEKTGKVEQLLNTIDSTLYNFAPDTITAGELSVKINGIEAKILNIEKVREYARGMNMYGYLIQILKPGEIKAMDLSYDKISILLNSNETGEMGLGETFVKRN